MTHPATIRAREILADADQHDVEHEVWRARHCDEDFWEPESEPEPAMVYKQIDNALVEPQQQPPLIDETVKHAIAEFVVTYTRSKLEPLLDRISTLETQMQIQQGINSGEIAPLKGRDAA